MTMLYVTTVICIGLMIGTEFAVSAFINPVLGKLEDHAQVQALRMFGAKLGRVMPFWYALGLVLLLAETFLARHEPAVFLLVIASGIWTLAIVLSVTVLVPINNKLVRAETDELTDAAKRDHRKWDALHRLRVAALIAAMVLLLVSVR